MAKTAHLEEIDPAKLRTEADMERLNAQAKEINLEEVTIQQIDVVIVEYVPVDDSPLPTRFKPVPRTAHIFDFVPMYLLNRLIASQKKVQRLRARIEAGEIEEPEEDPQMKWITEQVLAVWKLTEEDMTLERLQKGLDFERIYGLFARFFGEMLQRFNNSRVA